MVSGRIRNNVMGYEWITLLVGIAGGGITAWVSLSNNIARLNERVEYLERSEDAINKTLKELLNMVQEIKVLLAEKGIK